MATRFITCRTLGTSRCSDGYKHVARVGHTDSEGHIGTASLQEMLDWLAKLNNAAYTKAPDGTMAQVRPKVCECGIIYLTSKPDSSRADNLDNLPNC